MHVYLRMNVSYVSNSLAFLQIDVEFFLLVCPFVRCVRVWRCVPSHLYVLHRSNINIAWIHTNVIYLITAFFLSSDTVIAQFLCAAYWSHTDDDFDYLVWLYRHVVTFVSSRYMYVCVWVPRFATSLSLFFLLSNFYIYLYVSMCEHDGPSFIVAAQFSSVGFCNMFLRCHLFALLTYFVCLRNCFPAAKQQCTNSLQ